MFVRLNSCARPRLCYFFVPLVAGVFVRASVCVVVCLGDCVFVFVFVSVQMPQCVCLVERVFACICGRLFVWSFLFFVCVVCSCA